MDLTQAAPQINLIEEFSPTKQTVENLRPALDSTSMEMSLAEEPTRAQIKTFEAPCKPSVLDSTDYEVPDETLSDSVFASGAIEVQITDVNSSRRHQSIKSVTQRFVDQLNDQSFSTEDTKIEETSKLPKPNEVKFSQTEDIGEVCIEDSGHVSVNVKRVETTGMMLSPEHNLIKQVDLSQGQELMLSPKAKQLVAIIDRTPEKLPNRTLSRSMAASPICRNFNAPSIVISSATSTEDDTDPSPQKTVSKPEQKERRIAVEHSPVKKLCSDTSVSVSTEFNSRSSAKKKDFNVSKKNVSICKGNFEAEFRRCETFEMSRIMDEAGPSRMDLPKRNVSVSKGNFEAEFRRCEDFEMSRVMDEAGPSKRNVSVSKGNFEAEFRRCEDFEMSKIMEEAGLSRMDVSRRSEMDTSRKNKTFDCSEMSISFLPPETENRPQFSKILDEFDAVLPKKKCTELDVISRRMDEIILWYKERKESLKKDDGKDNADVPDAPVEVQMEVEQMEPEVPLTPIAAKLKEMSQK